MVGSPAAGGWQYPRKSAWGIDSCRDAHQLHYLDAIKAPLQPFGDHAIFCRELDHLVDHTISDGRTVDLHGGAELLEQVGVKLAVTDLRQDEIRIESGVQPRHKNVRRQRRAPGCMAMGFCGV